MKHGVLARFEEITRCPPEIQDALVSILSDKVMIIPELVSEDDRVLLAKPGFNVIATANTRDRGVHEMSSALKRRFNFETVNPIRDVELETTLVHQECDKLLRRTEAPVAINRDVVNLLVTTFHDLREGITVEGAQVERPSAVMSTAEAVSVAMAAGLDAFHYGKKKLEADHIGRHLVSTVIKDSPEDVRKLKHYFDVVVKQRSKKGGPWEDFLKSRKWLP
jgi:MoxR-like ATPase